MRPSFCLLPALLLGGALPARANTVRGQVTVPADADKPAGVWRLDNGVMPVAPRVPDPRSDAVIVLEGGPAPKAAEVTLELKGLRAEPRTLIVPPGGTLVVKNSDRVPHGVRLVNANGQVAAGGTTPLGAGQTQKWKIEGGGTFSLVDDDWPHINAWVVVPTESAASIADDKGAFKLDVPEGKYTLRLFWRGALALTQPLEVTGRTTELSLTVPPPGAAEGR